VKYKIAFAGLVIFLIGFLLASREYDFICGCTTPYPIHELDPCYQCLNSSKYQNDMLIFQLTMIVSMFVVLYGFFSEFDYGGTKSMSK
jgi:hypothetical protein